MVCVHRVGVEARYICVCIHVQASPSYLHTLGSLMPPSPAYALLGIAPPGYV